MRKVRQKHRGCTTDGYRDFRLAGIARFPFLPMGYYERLSLQAATNIAWSEGPLEERNEVGVGGIGVEEEDRVDETPFAKGNTETNVPYFGMV
jgi:hypothetical protein